MKMTVVSDRWHGFSAFSSGYIRLLFRLYWEGVAGTIRHVLHMQMKQYKNTVQ